MTNRELKSIRDFAETLAREVGGRVSDFRDGRFRIGSGEVLATNGLIHGQMVSVLNKDRIHRGS